LHTGLPAKAPGVPLRTAALVSRCSRGGDPAQRSERATVAAWKPFPSLASVGNHGQRYAVQETFPSRPMADGKGPTAMLSAFCSPSRYTQGKNATAALGSELLGLGLRGPALLVAGRSARRLLSSTWQTTFGEAGIEHAVHHFGGECSLAEIERVK